MAKNALNKALLKAVIKNQPAQVKTLLEHGADPNYTEDDAHITPLHFAALYNSLDVIHLLMMAGANIHAKNIDDETPLRIAENNKNYQVIGVLQHLFTGVETVQ